MTFVNPLYKCFPDPVLSTFLDAISVCKLACFKGGRPRHERATLVALSATSFESSVAASKLADISPL
jgi:hypothetical protein